MTNKQRIVITKTEQSMQNFRLLDIIRNLDCNEEEKKDHRRELGGIIRKIELFIERLELKKWQK